MNVLWNKLGDNYLSGIEQGTLHVTYSDGTKKTYGNGEMPRADLKVYKSKLFKRMTLYGDIGFAESYMDGDFETSDMTSLITLALINSKTLATKSEDRSYSTFTNIEDEDFFNKYQ